MKPGSFVLVCRAAAVSRHSYRVSLENQQEGTGRLGPLPKLGHSAGHLLELPGPPLLATVPATNYNLFLFTLLNIKEEAMLVSLNCIQKLQPFQSAEAEAALGSLFALL